MQSEQGSVMSVFEAVAGCGEVSRAQLSDMTGFSLMTVGKAVDILTSCGVITQRKRSDGTAGRRTSVCAPNKECGMLLYELSGDRCRVRVTDLSLAVCGEYCTAAEDLGELTLSGFGYFIEAFGGELLGIGCVVPDGKSGEYAEGFAKALGHAPELIVEASRAYAVANSARLDAVGMAVLLRLCADGSVDGALTYGGRLYVGAHGCAGGFSRLIDSRESLIERLGELCAVIDPEVVHISCEGEHDCQAVLAGMEERLTALGIDGGTAPQLIVEPTDVCRDELDGAARLLREKYILSKMANNT